MIETFGYLMRADREVPFVHRSGRGTAQLDLVAIGFMGRTMSALRNVDRIDSVFAGKK